MQQENKVIVKLNCFPARFLAARRVGVSRFFVSDGKISVRSKIGRCRITTFRQNTDFNVGLTPDLHAKQRGFTLIELLVVVLIIGILAAVALPQYQKTVWKTRGTQLLVAVQALHTAQKAYYLANGTFASTFDELSIEMPFKSPCGSGTIVSYSSSYTDCKSNNYGFTYIEGNGNSFALFRSDSPKYRWSGFLFEEKENSQYPNELLCTDMAKGKKSFCALMGWNTKISCNNNGICTYRK